MADTVLSITFNILTSRKLKKLCRDIAKHAVLAGFPSIGLFTRVVAARWGEDGAMLCL